MPSRPPCRCADPSTALAAGPRRAWPDATRRTDDLARDDAHRAFHAAVVELADNRQLDIALEPILLKLQLPMAMNLREEARHHRADDGVDAPRAILAALETNDAATVLAALEDHGHLHYLGLERRRSLTRSTHSRTETAIILSTIDSYGS